MGRAGVQSCSTASRWTWAVRTSTLTQAIRCTYMCPAGYLDASAADATSELGAEAAFRVDFALPQSVYCPVHISQK